MLTEELERYIEQLGEAVNFVHAAEVDEGIRKTLRRALMSELELKHRELETERRYERRGKPYTKDEKALIESECKNHVVNTWDEEFAFVNALSERLRRDQKSVKRQVIKMGYQRAVDYWLNRRESDFCDD